ncbi:Wzz/FepE/Etk N-terminal domain-containing protein [Hydrogenophaga palleronii]|uniref:Wzz/FepE/Etk N-terminal domain-containing protein n=1 Tax=Hydrogenophaga palleronii TaxID=65655 RepID=UPI0008270F9A|nr:Wzz/FepE/Etk N-terminal domain-containing protein [Hydrogenophaga palleronii]
MEIHKDARPELDAELDNNIDLFDVFLTIAENLRLLVLGSLLAGVCAYGLAFLLPPKFESSAVLRADVSFATAMTSPSALHSSLKKLGYLEGLNDVAAEDARETLAENVRASVGRNDKLITLTVAGKSPSAAQALNREILNYVYEMSKPSAYELNRLDIEKTALTQQVAELITTLQRAQRLLEEAPPSANLGALAESISSITSNLISLRERLRLIDSTLRGLADESLVQHPTLAQKPVAPKKGMLAVLATVGAGFALLVFVFTRNSWRASSLDGQRQQRVLALKRRFAFAR